MDFIDKNGRTREASTPAAAVLFRSRGWREVLAESDDTEETTPDGETDDS